MDNMFGGRRRYWNCWYLYDLMHLVAIKSQILSDRNSWTTKMLLAGPRLILKKIGEEQTELFLAVNYETNREVVMESIDLVFHVVLLARSIGLNLNNIIRLIDRFNTETPTQHPMNRPNLLRINRPNYGMYYPLLTHNIQRINQCNVIFGRLNSSILNLFMVVVGLGKRGWRYYNVLTMLFFEVLQNIITLMRYRNIGCLELFNEVNNRAG
ncbi:Phosphoribosyl-AMP cyclohydrolase [Candidatus Hodgkinia cicadicola]|uniref:phosphoribosyl-ATP diphosphatase n=1 Tax=Candidatus Hodgkinia cicadicola TaxID=573658 RepID=A0ABX4MF51_9HYPH|nr:Phosphoribosyl-AMP cyclohydrolase [Candidatus Hodgkinia cicadicola]PIM96924.1 Phosphoribosyl-AMP cyclohydrolase [Candidatus Hodgkinia cicadicola]